MKHFAYITTALIIILSLFSCMGPEYAKAYSVQYDAKTHYTYDDIDTLIELIEEQSLNMDAAQKIIQGATHLGYENNSEVIKLARQEFNTALTIKKSYQVVYNDLMDHWRQKEEEYPTATYIWSYLKEQGYNNQVCAGILGNIMTEAGGDTLEIKWDAETNDYYGICQWSKSSYADMLGASLDEQCKYLSNTIEYNIDAFGPLCYKKGFDYKSFIAMSNVQEIALAFAKSYERCSSDTYAMRQNNAVTAYNYFIG